MSDCYILRVLKEGFCSQLMATKECFSYFYNVSVRYLEIFPGYLNFRERRNDGCSLLLDYFTSKLLNELINWYIQCMFQRTIQSKRFSQSVRIDITVKSRFVKPPWETKIGMKNQGLNYTVRLRGRKQVLVQVIGWLEKARV